MREADRVHGGQSNQGGMKPMSSSLSMLDMTVEAIYEELCAKCKKKVDLLRENLRKRKVEWIKDQFWNTD